MLRWKGYFISEGSSFVTAHRVDLSESQFPLAKRMVSVSSDLQGCYNDHLR